MTGYVKCDQLTSRFADKSALIENDAYFRFNQSMKDFIIVSGVLPSLTEYEDVLITREESKIYKEIDKVMGQAVLEMLQTSEEVEGFEVESNNLLLLLLQPKKDAGNIMTVVVPCHYCRHPPHPPIPLIPLILVPTINKRDGFFNFYKK